jgi:GxxExxY protein
MLYFAKKRNICITPSRPCQGAAPSGAGRRTRFFVFFVSLVYTIRVHSLFKKADELSHLAIGAAIEVHRLKGPALIESIYERCLMRELDLRKIAAVNQRLVKIEYKGLVFEEPLRSDVLAEDCLLLGLNRGKRSQRSASPVYMWPYKSEAKRPDNQSV